MITDKLVFTKEKNLQDIANALRKKYVSDDKINPDNMGEMLDSIKLGYDIERKYYNDSSINIDITPAPSAEWQRPEGCPDISQIPIDYESDEEVLYMTFDNRRSENASENSWAGFAAALNTVGAYYVVERGTVDNRCIYSSSDSSINACYCYSS